MSTSVSPSPVEQTCKKNIEVFYFIGNIIISVFIKSQGNYLVSSVISIIGINKTILEIIK